MNNLPELSYDEAKSIIRKTVKQTMPLAVKVAPDIVAQSHATTLATILLLSRIKKVSDEVFRKSIEGIINPSGLTPEHEECQTGVCPKCGSRDISDIGPDQQLLKRYKCLECGSLHDELQQAPEAGITLPIGSVRDHPATDPVSVAAAVIEAKGAL